MNFITLPSSKQLRQAPRIVKLLVAQQFLEGFVPISALYVIMFQRAGGLNFEQIGLLFSIWSLVYVAAELPSGVLADYWSRRNVIIIGGLARAVGFVIWIIWPTFTGYAIGFALWGVMIACTSGAVAAYLHDELEAESQQKRYAQYFGWVLSASSLGMLIGYAVAAVLTLRHSFALNLLSVCSSLLFAALLFGAKEHPYKKQTSYFKTLLAGVKAIRQSGKLRYVCTGLFATFMIIGVIEELLPQIYASFGLNDTAVSLVLASSLVVSVVLLARMEKLVRFSLTTQMLVMSLGVGCLLAGLYKAGLAGSGLLLAFSLIFVLFRLMFQHHVQAVARSGERATIGSIPGLAGGLLGAGAYAVIGKTGAQHGERLAVGLYGAVWLVLLLLLALAGRRYGSVGQSVVDDAGTVDTASIHRP